MTGVGTFVKQAMLMVWCCMQQAERCAAQRLVLVAPDEWEQGLVRVKDQATREEKNIPVEQITDV